jgi:predicted RecA/RadA family phage recombinase
MRSSMLRSRLATTMVGKFTSLPALQDTARGEANTLARSGATSIPKINHRPVVCAHMLSAAGARK